MFGLFRRDPIPQLHKAYAQKLEQAREAGNVDRARQAELMAEAEVLFDRLEAAKAAKAAEAG